MKHLLLALVAGMSCTILPNAEEIRRSQPQKKLSTYEAMKRDVLDFLLFENKGYKAVSEENEVFIRDIQKKLNMSHYNIEIRSMSNWAVRGFGRMNAFVIPSLTPRTGLNYLFISEEWFETLNLREKTALIGHELVHIRNNHLVSKLYVIVVCEIVRSAAVSHLANEQYYPFLTKEKRLYGFAAASTAVFLASLAAQSYHSRLCEQEADIESAQLLNAADGGVELWDNFIAHTKDPESRFALKRFWNKAVTMATKPFAKTAHFILGTHPEIEERKAYMEELAKEQAAALSVA